MSGAYINLLTQDTGPAKQATPYVHGVRAADDESTTAKRALEKLREGNVRFVEGRNNARNFYSTSQLLQEHGHNPFAAVISSADLGPSVEFIFSTLPGDLFSLSNAGNALTHAKDELIGSVEYCLWASGTKLVLVMGHTESATIKGATQMMIENKGKKVARSENNVIKDLLASLGPVARIAEMELPAGATADEIAAHATKVNVWNTIECLLNYSKPIRDAVSTGDVEVHGGIYDVVSGKVEFLGQSPKLSVILASHRR